ncbi:MAG: serine/threonine-protein phosphatase [Kiritimatiellae bacterium]|nr:serine/threonine-protein phosphatase [Kiritimatiellia bacterium]
MADDIYIEMECAQFTKTGQAACGDDVRFLNVERENRYIAALSDGLGSGVKAHVLSNMTTTMALRFLQSNMPTLESVEIMMDSLPVCEVRKISYATFSLFDFSLGGRAKILEMGNPGYIHLRGVEEIAPVAERHVVSVHWPDRTVRECEADFRPGDRIVMCSDGVTQAGLGESRELKFGLRRSGVLRLARERISAEPGMSARDLSNYIARASINITRGICRDDVSCVVIYVRHPRVMRVLTGPPFHTENDGEFARQAGLGEEHVVVCGGTTANILERELGAKVKISLSDMRSAGSLPPAGRMPGVALATEGILTLGRVLSALEEHRPPDGEPAAAKEILKRFAAHDRIEFVVGTKVNECHQDPNIPQELELRRSVVRRLAGVLEREYRKTVKLNFY